MPKRVVRLYDTVSVPALDKSPEKIKFINDNFFAPQRDSSLLVRVAATHAGIITKNNGFYLPDKMSQGASSMMSPFPKPILLHHDSYKDPIGRIVNADYINTANTLFNRDSKFKGFTDSKTSFIAKLDLVDALFEDGHLEDPDFQGLGYISVVAKITDPEAIQKIADSRLMTVSIGASTDRAVCSICKSDWVDEGPCEHRPGKTYDEKPAFIIAGNLTYEELSFVNSPADPFARVIEVQNSKDEVQRIELDALTEEDDTVVDSEAQLFIVTDDQHHAVNLLETKGSTAESVKSLLQAVEENKASEEDTHDETKEISDEEGDMNVGGRHQHLNNAPMGAHFHHVDDELPGDHMHTEDNPKGLHFHMVGDKPTGAHEHDGKNPMGVHEHPEREPEDGIDKEASGMDSVDEDVDDQDDAAHRSPQTAYSPSPSKKKKKKKKKKDSMEDEPVDNKELKDKKTDAEEKDNKQEEETNLEDSKASEDTTSEKGNTEVKDEKETKKEVTSEETKVEDSEEDGSEEEIEDTKETEEEEIKDTSEVLKDLKIADVANADVLRAKLKEAYDFFTDEQIQEAVEKIQKEASKKGFEDKDDNIFVLIHRVLGIIEDRDFDAEAMYGEIAELVGEDAKLGTARRKKLPSSAFCGPNRSFPVPDCAHVTAARRLIGRAKLSAGSKARVLACVSRKAKALGCEKKSKDEVQPTEIKVPAEEKKELTCDTFTELSNEQIENVHKWIVAEMEERELEVSSDSEDNSKELETLKEREEALVAEQEDLKNQLSALRSELKDVYGDCSDLEDAKAELLEKLHKERAQRLCDLRVLTGEIKDQGELEQKLEEEVEKASEVIVQSLKDLDEKVNLYEIAEKLDDGMGNKPEGTVDDPTLSNNDSKQDENSDYEKIRKHYRELLASKGQRDADSYKSLVLKSGFVPRNFKF